MTERTGRQGSQCRGGGAGFMEGRLGGVARGLGLGLGEE